MVHKFPETPQGITDYIATLQKGKGFIANCCSGWPEGYMLHSASCPFLDSNKNRNPIMRERGTGKIWAATLAELEANIRQNQSTRPAGRCPSCL
jgi:hypothetical protein